MLPGGVYFAAAWLDVFGEESDRWAMRLGHLIAFPLLHPAWVMVK